jgi:hypothetical protein
MLTLSVTRPCLWQCIQNVRRMPSSGMPPLSPSPYCQCGGSGEADPMGQLPSLTRHVYHACCLRFQSPDNLPTLGQRHSPCLGLKLLSLGPYSRGSAWSALQLGLQAPFGSSYTASNAQFLGACNIFHCFRNLDPQGSLCGLA